MRLVVCGTDEESDASLRDRFLFRIQNPIALFNENAIIDQAKTVPGVTRVFVQGNDFFDGQLTALTLTKNGDFTAVFETATPHGLTSGQPINVTGAAETDYNVIEQKILILDSTNFIYTVDITTPTPATGAPIASFGVSEIGTVRIFFVRDNDINIIPSPSEIQDVKDAILEIKPITVSESESLI